MKPKEACVQLGAFLVCIINANDAWRKIEEKESDKERPRDCGWHI